MSAMRVYRTGRRSRRFAVGAALALVSAGVLAAVFIRLVGSTQLESRLGSRVFVSGRAVDLAHAIRQEGPLLFADLLGGSRDIYLQQQGDDPQQGWLAFDAHAPGSPRRCTLAWQADTGSLRDPCSGVTFPADGMGLVHYTVTINARGRVVIDLLAPVPPSTP